MTAASEIKSLLKVLSFNLEEGTEATWVKSYANHNNYKIKIDLDKGQIDYGKHITVVGKTTSNLKAAENLVVLECVNRLLEKGYKPQNIYLEKTWATGHGTSGRLDIFVTRDNGSAYLMIECKTFGAEFDKESKRILKDGGQLFTYFQQDKNAEILMLYASGLDKTKVQYCNDIVKIEDDYRQTGNVKDFYDRWNKLPKNNGVFDTWVGAYDFQSKALTPKNLKDIKQEDSSFIFNQFLEILRHNVVSDKPNAFNKIFTLFLCKIYDEKITKPNDELAFQWFYTPYIYEGISYPPDDNVSFQKRLTDLYRKGMKEFLDKSVTDISDSEFEKKYGKLDAVTKKQILDEFTEIRLKKNNEFAIKEVFNDASFVENAKVVKEVVELLQGFKIRYTKKQQYLSDFFELLLTTGLKQESGQFFTPVPIAQFIIKSIPLDKIVASSLEKGEKDNLLPTIIDYAAGSGHFITESMHEIQRIIDKTNPEDFIESTAKKISSWKTDHFDWAYQYVYGIEKDYRLVKVGKVGCYLHGDGLAQIIHTDGLGNFLKTEDYKGFLKNSDKDFPKENKQFDIVVSNPPYSVAAFKNNARKYYTEADFDLYDKLTDQSSEIECLFIERTKQLLKDGGIAGIILPSSILSNGGIYIKTREIILRYFDILAIAELGSNTFMATGTNTVTLFLRRKNNYAHSNILDLVEKAVSDKKDVTINGIEKPISKYVSHVWKDFTVKDYFTLCSKKPNEAIAKSELYKEYLKKFKSKSEDDFWKAVLSLESEKLFYFILAYPQKIVLLKSGEKNEEKDFLGYEFSTRRGSEGIHPIQRGKSIDECTKLFDPDVFNNPEKASTYIYNAFLGDFDCDIHPSLSNNISRLDLIDTLTFDRVDFEKSISLSVKKKVKIESKWNEQKLSDVLTALESGKRPKGGVSEYQSGIPSLGGEHILLNGTVALANMKFVPQKFFDEANQGILNDLDILICKDGALTGKTAIYKKADFPYAKAMVNEHVFILRTGNKITQKYLFNLLYSSKGQEILKANITGQAQGGLNRENLLNIKVPIPSKGIQSKIVSEMEQIAKRENSAISKRAELETAIANELRDLKYKEEQLANISSFKNGLNYSRQSTGDFVDIIGVKDFQNNFIPNLDRLEKIQIDGKLSDDYNLKPGDLLVVRSNGSANLVGRFLLVDKLKTQTSFSGFTIRIRPDAKVIDSKFLAYYLRTDIVRNKLVTNSAGSNIKSLNQGLLSSIKVPLPSLAEQKKIAAKIEKIELQIEAQEKIITQAASQKEAILSKHL